MLSNSGKRTEIKYPAMLLLTWGLFFVILFSRILYFKPGGLYAGCVNVWSDWSLHIGMASIFAYKSPAYWFSYHPMFADGQLTYPFLTNMISGFMMRAGFSLTQAFIWPSIAFSLALLSGMYALWRMLLRSPGKAYLAISLFFLSAGLGFLSFLVDLSRNPGLGMFLNPPLEYSRLDSFQWYAGNFVTGMLAPQRAFLLGMALAVWSLAGLLYVLLKRESGEKDKIILFISGCLAGILPVVHPHSLIALVFLSGLICLASLKKWKLLCYYVIPAALISATLYFVFIHGGINNPHFMSFRRGYSNDGLKGFVKFWFWVWGFMIPAAIAGFAFFTRGKPPVIKAFFAGFFLLFVLANFIVFQPVLWDNSKIFLWCYFGFSALAAELIAWLWNKKLAMKALSAILVLLLTFTGMLELIHLQRIDKNSYQMLSNDEIAIAQEIREKTGPLERFATSFTHKNPVMVLGCRPILLGFTPWAWNFGFNYGETERDVRAMYLGGPDAAELIARHKVSYVYISPAEMEDLKANQSYFEGGFPLAFRRGDISVYDVRSAWGK